MWGAFLLLCPKCFSKLIREFAVAKLGVDFYIMCQSADDFAHGADFFAVRAFLRKIGLYLQ